MAIHLPNKEKTKHHLQLGTHSRRRRLVRFLKHMLHVRSFLKWLLLTWLLKRVIEYDGNHFAMVQTDETGDPLPILSEKKVIKLAIKELTSK